MLIDSKNWRPHRPWVFFTIIATVLATVWYVRSSQVAREWLGGSSIPGFTFGIIGGLICAFEMLLWWRKKVRVWRIGRTQVWMRAHIWLGLLSVPLLVFHSGFRWGGLLSTVLMVLFLIVIVSGVWGLAMQQVLPRIMLHDVPAETIYSQIDYIVAQLTADAERLVIATCGPAPGEDVNAPSDEPGEEAYLTIGAVRTAGQVQGKVLQTRVPTAPVPNTEPLRIFFYERVKPYLRHGKRSDSPLKHPVRSEGLFRNLRTLLPPGASETVDALVGGVEQRRQLDRQAQLHFWLHNWLWLHLPLAAALIILMLVHIFVALKYW
ncbi:MAG: hypothetical protein K2R98_13210 [Gemmataceae bacterium]|nr:hypothetical protein [Gemmataceae bacterium]